MVTASMSPQQSRLRVGRQSLINHYYHVTFTTLDRRAYFNHLLNARLMINTLRLSDDKKFTQTMCFVIMPDHVHWLFQLKQTNLSQVIQRVKGMVSREIGQNVWQKGFYDHAIRNDESLKSVARYIIANPVRAGICQSAKMYSHWDAVWV